MARYQYRLNGAFSWVSSPGNALLALQNKSGSGKRITIRSLELQSQFARNYSLAGRGVTLMAARGNQLDGEPLTPVPHDSDAGDLPEGLTVVTGGTFSTVSMLANSVVMIPPRHSPAANLSLNNRSGLLYSDCGVRQSHSSVEKFTLLQGDIWGLSIIQCPRVCALEATVRFVTIGSPNRTWTARAYGIGLATGGTLISIVNFREDEGNVVIVDYSVRMLGATGVTPYVQIVPFSAADPSAIESNSDVAFLKMDSDSPDAETWVNAIFDTPLVPAGAPIQYANDSGAGSPKNANYLQTKDFLGPVVRTFFPEFYSHLGMATSVDRVDSLGYLGHRHSDLNARGAGIVLRPGEGLAAVMSAETFSSAASAASMGGETPLHIGITFDVENEVQPYLTLTGLQTGSDVVILTPNTTTVLDSVDSIGGTTYSLAYDPDVFTNVDVRVYKAGYMPFSVHNVDLGSQGLTIPVVQLVDPSYID